ncbi:MAG: stage II sporulation protein M [Aureispira sp.]
MRETHFIEQNKEKWAQFERNLGGGYVNPDELSDQFVEITDDLSYSRTFYPNRSVRVYLNNIAQKVFYNVYKNRRGRLSRVLNFWKETVPQIIYESRSSFLLAFAVFIGATIIGVFSTYMDAEFPRVILGDEYIDMTMNNIENGNPMAVYQGADQQEMFLRIAFNNLKVSVWCFALGLLFGVGSLFVLIQNGIMLGAFQYLFIREGIYLDSFFTIWMHGAIEISCIIIAGAAGLTLGSGLVFPKTLTRLQSLQLSARRGLLILLTVLPLIVLAAFIEGFITRYTEASYILRGIVIFGSFAFIISYYVIYPYLKAKKGFISFIGDVKLPPAQKLDIQYNQIKTTPQIFSDAFIAYRKFIKPIGVVAGVIATLMTSILLLGDDVYRFKTMESVDNLFQVPFLLVEFTVDNLYQLFSSRHELFIFLFFIGFTICVYIALFLSQQLVKKVDKEPVRYKPSFFVNTILSTILGMGLLGAVALGTGEGVGVFFLALLTPVVLMWLVTAFNENRNPLTALGRSFKILGGNWLVMMGAYFIIIGMCTIFIFMATAPLAGFYLGVIVNLFPVEDILTVKQGFYIFVYTFLLSFLLPLIAVVMNMAFHSFKEIKEADSLLEEIPLIGKRKISYGMEQEN